MRAQSGELQFKPLGEIAQILRGVTYQKADARTEPGPGFVPLVRATNIGPVLDLDGELVYVPQHVVNQSQLLRVGDIVLASSSGSLSVVGKSARLTAPWKGTFGAFCAVVRPGPDVDDRYLALYLSSKTVRRQWSDSARGTNINNLKRADLEPTPIPLPPLDDQRRIADILEDHLSRLDATDRNVATAKSKLEVLDLSLLSYVRRSLLDRSVSLVPLGKFCDTALGKMLDAKRAVGQPTPYLRNINVRWRGFDLDDVKAVPLTESERDRLRLRAGDLMVCEGGEPGRCAVWTEDDALMAYQKALHRVRVTDRTVALPDFVARMLEEFVRVGRANCLFTGTTIKHLPQEKLRLIELPLPDLQTQQAVLDHLEVASLAGRRMADEMRVIHTKQDALRRSLLAAAFSGRLTGRASDMDLVEEMASV